MTEVFCDVRVIRCASQQTMATKLLYNHSVCIRTFNIHHTLSLFCELAMLFYRRPEIKHEISRLVPSFPAQFLQMIFVQRIFAVPSYHLRQCFCWHFQLPIAHFHWPPKKSPPFDRDLWGISLHRPLGPRTLWEWCNLFSWLKETFCLWRWIHLHCSFQIMPKVVCHIL